MEVDSGESADRKDEFANAVHELARHIGRLIADKVMRSKQAAREGTTTGEKLDAN